MGGSYVVDTFSIPFLDSLFRFSSDTLSILHCFDTFLGPTIPMFEHTPTVLQGYPKESHMGLHRVPTT